ncbi:RES family NAD+ phosphorylase [Ectothiorhodospiraceae bacterium 2226]|nr:RES family NAD+ phosphorylase [Ectothiorhodospiraceae bacterium 2226]
MWTPTALASETRPLGGDAWRAVEHQYSASTRKIVDTQAEQDVLESILEESKPRYPAAAAPLHYLLKSPFRYYPPRPHGSRFRRAGDAGGVFYGAERLRTALAELAYYRLRFFAASPATPLPRNEERLTAFRAAFRTARALDLTQPPLERDRALWTDPQDYGATQALAEAARAAEVEVIRYESVRDAERGANLALLQPGVFTSGRPLEQQTWYLYLSPLEVNCTRANGAGEERWTFPRAQFGL